MEVEAGIGLFEAGVGHVLKAIAEAPVRGDVPIEAEMAGELSTVAEIGRTKAIAADVAGAEPAFNRKRNFCAADFQNWAQGADESVIAALAEPTGGKSKARLQMPIGARAPMPKVVIEERLGLQEMVAGAFGAKPDASASGLKPEFLFALLRVYDKWQRTAEGR